MLQAAKALKEMAEGIPLTFNFLLTRFMASKEEEEDEGEP